MRTIIRKKGPRIYRWFLVEQETTIASGLHVGSTADLKQKIQKCRDEYYSKIKACHLAYGEHWQRKINFRSKAAKSQP